MLEIIIIGMALALLLCTWRMADSLNATLLTALGTETANILESCTVHLFVNNVTYSYSTILSGLTEATFSGYAAVTLPVGTPGSISSQTLPISYGGATFTRSTTGASQTAYGYYLLNGSSQLIGGGTFPSPGPYVFTNSGDNLTVDITLNEIIP